MGSAAVPSLSASARCARTRLDRYITSMPSCTAVSHQTSKTESREERARQAILHSTCSWTGTRLGAITGDTLPPQTLGTHTGVRLAPPQKQYDPLAKGGKKKKKKKRGTGRRGGRGPTWAALVSMASNSARPMCGTPATASASCRPMPTSAGRFPSCTRKIDLRQVHRYQFQATPQCCSLMPNPTPAGCFLCSLCVMHHRTQFSCVITVAFHRSQSSHLTHACHGCILFCASSTHVAMASTSQDVLSMRERSSLRPAQRAQASGVCR